MLGVEQGGIPWPQTGTTHYQAQLGPQDKGPAIKGLVVCWSMARINDICDGSMDQRKVRGQVPCCGQDSYRAQVPQRPIDSYNI